MASSHEYLGMVYDFSSCHSNSSHSHFYKHPWIEMLEILTQRPRYLGSGREDLT